MIKLLNNENKQFMKVILTIGLPILVQNFISALVNFIDAVMVGALGDSSVAAVGASNQIYFLLTLIILGISSGIAVFMAQYWGKKDIVGLKKSVIFGLFILIPFMILITLLIFTFTEFSIGIFTEDPETITIGKGYLKIISWSYLPAALSIFLSYSLRSIEKVRVSVYITIAALLTNVILNYFLIFGIGFFPELGVKGAAIATLTARLFQMSAIVFAIYYKDTGLAIKHVSGLWPEPSFVRRFINTSGSVFLNEVLYGIGSAMFFAILGRLSLEMFTGANIAKQTETLIWIFFWSMCAAASVSIGKQIGEKDYAKAQSYALKFIWTGILVSIILALGLLLSIPFIVSLFNVSELTKEMATIYLLVFVFVIIFRGPIKILTGGVMRAGGDVVFVMLWDLIPMYLALVLCLVIGWQEEIPKIWILITMLGYEFVKVVPTINRVKSRKWIHNLVDDSEI